MPAVSVAAGGWPETFWQSYDCWNSGSISAARSAVEQYFAARDSQLRWLGCNVVVGIRPPRLVAPKVNSHLLAQLQQAGSRRTICHDDGAVGLGFIAVDWADDEIVFAIFAANFWVQFVAARRVSGYRASELAGARSCDRHPSPVVHSDGMGKLEQQLWHELEILNQSSPGEGDEFDWVDIDCE